VGDAGAVYLIPRVPLENGIPGGLLFKFEIEAIILPLFNIRVLGFRLVAFLLGCDGVIAA